MNVESCTKTDFDAIVSSLSDFWGHDRNRALHHPMFVNEFVDCAYVIRDEEKVVAYLFGLIAHAKSVAYIHLVAVRPSHRQLGLARQLYNHFTSLAVSRGCRQLRAITSPDNSGSIRFHKSLGFQLEGAPNAAGVPVVKDYAGPGLDRVVFCKNLQAAVDSGVATAPRGSLVE
jgi:ribosomal protein S18 acetylase RimI-like enzyme